MKDSTVEGQDEFVKRKWKSDDADVGFREDYEEVLVLADVGCN